MVWWPREHIGFERWRVDRRHRDRNSVDATFDEEACHATCPVCDADLFVVLRFHENVPERVLAIGKGADWPAVYAR